MKPPNAKGSRGFRILSADVDRRFALLEARPGPLPLSVDEALEAIGDRDFPPLLVMQLASGEEHTVDGICRDGELRARPREDPRADPGRPGDVLPDPRERPELLDAARRLCRTIGLEWFVNVQFIGPYLLEINPRISTIVYQEDLNLPYLAVKHAVGELTQAELAAYGGRVRSTRRALRYYDQVEWDDSGLSRSGWPGGSPSLGKQSLVYGLGSVVSRFASLLLLPVYAAYLNPGDYGRVENLTALVAVAATISQLGMVNALFRFALERTGDARWAVVRTAIGFCACTGGIMAIAAALLTPLVASAILQGDHTALWLVSCVGLWVALVYEPTVGLYRVEQRPTRFLHDHAGQRRRHGRGQPGPASSCSTPTRSVWWPAPTPARRWRWWSWPSTGGASCSGRSTGRCCGRCCASGCRSCRRGWRSGRSTCRTG